MSPSPYKTFPMCNLQSKLAQMIKELQTENRVMALLPEGLNDDGAKKDKEC